MRQIRESIHSHIQKRRECEASGHVFAKDRLPVTIGGREYTMRRCAKCGTGTDVQAAS